MNPALSLELQRLYDLALEADAPSTRIDRQGRVRALVLALRRAPDWQLLGRVWRGVQSEWGWPAPAIAVSGVDAMQLWFSLAEPMPAAQAQELLARLQAHFLPEVEARRVQRWPRINPGADPQVVHADPVPALQPDGNWSAFLAPDLAPVFGDTPWLDIEPNEDGQASLLRGLKSLGREELDAALQALPEVDAQAGRATPTPTPTTGALVLRGGALAAPPASGGTPSDWDQAGRDLALPGPAHAAGPTASDQARAFLLRVMNDERCEMALRIDAAKALLKPAG